MGPLWLKHISVKTTQAIIKWMKPFCPMEVHYEETACIPKRQPQKLNVIYWFITDIKNICFQFVAALNQVMCFLSMGFYGGEQA